MSETPPIGLPNLVSQGEQVARTRGAASGAEAAFHDRTAIELEREAVRRARAVAGPPRVEAVTSRQHDTSEGQDAEADRHSRYDAEPDDEGDDLHRLDVSA